MKHDDAFSNALFESSTHTTESAAIEIQKANNSAIERTNLSALAPVKRFEANQSIVKEAEKPTVPIVDDFLPVPNRWLIFGSLGLVGGLGLGFIFLTALPHRTVIKAKAKVQPTTEPQLLQSGSGGTVKSIFVQNYDSLTPKQVVVSFDNQALSAEFNTIQTNIAQSSQQLNNVNEEIAILQQRQASGNWLAFKTPQGQFEFSKRLLLEYQDELQQQLTEQQKQLASVQQKIDNTKVYAPVAGTLYDLEIKNVGQAIEANQPIAKIVPADTTLHIKAVVSEVEARNIEVGFPTQINLNSCEYSNFGILEGEVKAVEALTPQSAESFISEAPSVGNTNQHIVTIETNTDTRETGTQPCKLLPGAEGNVSIIAKQERFLNFFLRKLRLSRDV
ncbi:MAG: HlyD family efflux transporter periplasmic adaptor subunit [Cyanobacteria bacterium P01_D01_bin.56]